MRALKCPSGPWPSAANLLADFRLLTARKPARAASGLPQTYRVGARSLFVTGTAWVFMALALLLGSLAVWRGAEAAPLLQGLVLSLATLVCAAGMWRRLNWARYGFIALLGVVIAVALAGLLLQPTPLSAWLARGLALTPWPMALFEPFGGVPGAARWMAALLTLAACGLLAWVIRGLMAPAVRQEFA